MTVIKLTATLAAAIAGATIGAPAAVNTPSPGEQRRWTLDFRAKLEQPGGRAPIEVRLSGDWISTISGARPHEFDTALQLLNARVTGAGIPNAPANALSELEHRLGQAFWATYRDDGALLAVHFSPGVDPSDENLLQMVATEAQIVRAEPDGQGWSVLERDGAGGYLAAYEKQEHDIVLKRKVKYVATDAAAGPANGLQVTIDRSELRFVLDADGGIAALDGTDRVRIGLPGMQKAGGSDGGQLAATTEIHLGSLRRARAPDLIGSLERAGKNVVNSAIVSHAADPDRTLAQGDDSLLDGHTTESLLEAATAKNGDHTLPGLLHALFRRRPEAIADTVALLRRNGPQKPLTDALGAVSSPATVAALDSLARDKALSVELRIEALNALVLGQHLSQQAMRIPAALLDESNAELKSVARFMSGAVARMGRADHPAEAEAIDKALIERFRKADEFRDLSDLLAALGNSGGAATLPVVEEALGDSRPAIRGAAVRALRLAPGHEIDDLLSKAITSDLEGSVRSDAIFAAGFRRPLSPQIGEALVIAARFDSADYVRGSAITLLRRNPKASPKIGETLSWIAANDSKPGVRRLAGEALASVSGSAAR